MVLGGLRQLLAYSWTQRFWCCKSAPWWRYRLLFIENMLQVLKACVVDKSVAMDQEMRFEPSEVRQAWEHVSLSARSWSTRGWCWKSAPWWRYRSLSKDNLLQVLNACVTDIGVAMDQKMRFEPLEVRQAWEHVLLLACSWPTRGLCWKLAPWWRFRSLYKDHILHVLNACFIDISVAMDQEIRVEPSEKQKSWEHVSRSACSWSTRGWYWKSA